MDKLVFRIFFIILLSLWAIYYVFPWSNFGLNLPFTWSNYKLWLDLQWWVELDYKVDLEKVSSSPDYDSKKEDSIIEWLKSIVDKRVEALNISDSVITTASYAWEKHIIVQIPLKWTNKEQDELNIKRAKESIWKVVKIEFKELRKEITPQDLQERKNISTKIVEEINKWETNFVLLQAKYKDNYENVLTWNMTWSIEELKKYFVLNDTSVWIKKEIFSWSWTDLTDKWSWILNILDNKNNVLKFDYIYVSNKPSDWQIALDTKGRALTDEFFQNSSVAYNEAFQPMVELAFNPTWWEIFGELTTRLKWQPIAIFVWGTLLTAPNVNEAILSGKAVITGDYTPEEAKKLSNDINTWVVPAPIYLTSERSIDSTLWSNSLQKLIYSWIVWFIAICIFLIIVYRKSWFYASISLLIYVILLLAVVKAFWVVLTLASIAWLILSIGIAIDANILIFERIKDSIREGHKLKKSVEEWFGKSWSAIWDSNLTGLIIALILFIFWINMIKWFWLMMWLWIIVSLFTAMYISRLFILLVIHNKTEENFDLKWFLGMKK